MRNEGRSGVSGSRERSDGRLPWAWSRRSLRRTNPGRRDAGADQGRINSAGGKVELDITQLAVGLLHGLRQPGTGRFVSAMLGAGYLDAASKRRLPGFATAKGDSEGWLYHASVKSGYRWRKDDWRVGRGSACWRPARNGRFPRKASELALDVDRASKDATCPCRTERRAQPRVADWSLEPELNLGYERALGVRRATPSPACRAST
ncbi:autotransporter domain-containing protein [Pseudomonas aeruginosa]|nr:autotransporter domain-containing protein [Pseudomonas aeruginosa]